MPLSFDSLRSLQHAGETYSFYSLPALAESFPSVTGLPYSLRILLENLLRHQDGGHVSAADVEALATCDLSKPREQEIAFMPARVLLQDFTGVPAVVDLAAMRAAMQSMGGDPQKIQPQLPVDLVVDHSVQIDQFGSTRAFDTNVELEYQRNRERYSFLRWGQQAFDGFRVVPPGTGICHQVNLEFLAKVVQCNPSGVLYPDSLVGTDSHTPMINALGVLGWGVGGIEAEAAMLGQPLSMLIPDVVGFTMTGQLPAGTTATDLVLRVVELLRQKGVVGKFVEFVGPGVTTLPLADRATISNMTPEFGATAGFFPVGDETLRYLHFSNRPTDHIDLVEAYLRKQNLYLDASSDVPVYSDNVELDLSSIEPAIAGPKRPQDRIPLTQVPIAVEQILAAPREATGNRGVDIDDDGQRYTLSHGSVVLAAITSCTNTSNPSVMIGAGLVAKKAVERGLHSRSWVKTSLAPGSQVVSDYLDRAGLTPYLQALGFHTVGYGCTTCIGNSGPLPEPVVDAIEKGGLHTAAVLSGNRNFEGRVSPHTQLNFLASPPLVVAFALAGRVNIDFATEPVGRDRNGQAVLLGDLWPSLSEVRALVGTAVQQEQFARRYAAAFDGDSRWQALPAPEGDSYPWQASSTYVRLPPFFENLTREPLPLEDIKGARVLALLADSVTTDHISPAGNIATDGPAARYLRDQGVEERDFNSFGSRRGNHEVMMRGTFANIRLRNALVPGVEGGMTRFLPDGEQMSIYDAAMRYRDQAVPLVVIAGAEYGTGSSRDWAAKGTQLLGVQAVLAKSFERIHRSNLVGMGVLPLQFAQGEDACSLGLSGEETFDVLGLNDDLSAKQELQVVAKAADGTEKSLSVVARVDTPKEVEYLRHGGILSHVLRKMIAKNPEK